jgi:hypothetical protein
MRQRGLMALALTAISVAFHAVAWSIWNLRNPTFYNEYLFAVASYVGLASTLALGLAVASISLIFIGPRAPESAGSSYSWPAIGSLAGCLAGWLCAIILGGAVSTNAGVGHEGANPIVALLLLAALGMGVIASAMGVGLGGWSFLKHGAFEQLAGAVAFILSSLSLALVVQLVMRGGL